MKIVRRAGLLLPIFFLLFFSLFIFINTAQLDSWRPLFNDNYSLGYPLRILISTSLRNGILPLWDHWTRAGFPLSVVNVSLPVSPFIWVLSIFGVYTMKFYVVEMLLMHVLGFFGCYFWIRRFASGWVSGIGAFCYTLMASGIIQAPINFEATAAGYTYPWIALGASLALEWDRRGIGILALSLWWMFTSGYVGMNLIACEFIFSFTIIEFLFHVPKPIRWNLFLRGIGFFGIGILLFLCLYSFPLFETWHIFGFDMKQIREAGANNPFAASARGSALFTMIFPNGVSPFVPDAFDGYAALLYFGALNSVFAIFSLIYAHKRRTTAWILFVFFIVSFLSTLSVKYTAVGTFFSSYLPFFRDSRWHAWNINIPTFFAVTLSAIGLQAFFQKRAGVSHFVACYLYGIFLVVAGVLWSPFFPFAFLKTPQSIVFIMFLLIIMPFHRMIDSKRWRLWLFIGTVFLLVGELWTVSKTLVLFNDRYTYLLPQQLRAIESMKTTNFPPIPNNRSVINYHINTQYYDKIPTVYGYNPIVMPAVFRLEQQPIHTELFSRFLYAVDANDRPKSDMDCVVDTLSLTPDALVARLTCSTAQKMVWSSGYTSNWKGTLDQKPMNTTKNSFGLTIFDVPAGTHTIRFHYRPWYLWLSFGLIVIGIITSFCMLIIPLFTLLRIHLRKS